MNTSASKLPKTGPIAQIVNEVLAAANSAFSDALNVVLILAGVMMLLSAIVALPWCGGRALPPAATSNTGRQTRACAIAPASSASPLLSADLAHWERR